MTFKYPDIATQAISRILAEKQSSYDRNVELTDVQEPIISAPPEVRRIIERVLQAEKDKLYMKNPRNINDDILRIIKEEVQ
ncbi:hypothetical protein [Limnofasciculus baicalensis]|uniref:Uncharacterized protein n=1 Tax=Limnofasciculus baicalensis BBK-W-15 TaxID=2699891 RepID=A0AAE3KMV4_9CYAN|nr:hypothetical protein [Limnofasciculus baicalensis]MCP2728008.1 hypothetical protein [Limnofasciculus baicalensis BBK-W-15]